MEPYKASPWRLTLVVLTSRTIHPVEPTLPILKSEVIVSLLIVLVAGSLGLGYLAGVSNRQVITTTSTKFLTTTTRTLTTAGPCGNIAQPQPGWPMGLTGSLDVMLVAPGSAGIACLLFGVNSTQQAQLNQDIQQVGSVYSLSNLSSPTQATGIRVTILSIESTPSNETIQYLIRVSGNSSGAYTWWAPGTCPGFPLVVGSNITTALSSLRSYFSSGFNCPAILFAVSLEGVSGMALTTTLTTTTSTTTYCSPFGCDMSSTTVEGTRSLTSWTT